MSANALDFFWDNGAGGGSWTTPSNWSSDIAGTDTTAIPGVNDIAYFNINGLGTTQSVALGGSLSVNGLVYNNNAGLVTLTGGTGQVLTIGSGGIKFTGSTTSSSTTTKSFTIAASVSSVQLTGNQSWEATVAPASGSTVRADDGLYILAPVTLAAGVGNTTLTLGGGSTSSSTPLNRIGGVISDGADGVLSIEMNPAGGSNRWTLSGNNTYTGTTTIRRGALTIGHGNALGSTSAGTVVESGAGLFLRATIANLAAEQVSLSGTGPDGKGALRNVGGSNTWNGQVTANTASGTVAIGSGPGANFTFATAATISTGASGTLQFTTDTDTPGTAVGTITVNSDISGGANVSKVGSAVGILTLAGQAKTYSGTTTVSTGFLTLNTSLTNTSAVTVASAATLRGNGGSINTSALTTVNGTFAPGATANSIGALATGNLQFNAESRLAIDIHSDTSEADLITITGNLALDATNAVLLSVNDLGTTALAVGTVIDIVRYSGAWNGNLFTYGGEVIADESTTFTSGLNTFQIDYDRVSGPDTFVSLVVVIPEAGVTTLALSGAMFGLVRRRRR